MTNAPTMHPDDAVRLSFSGNIATLRLVRPDKRNALNDQTIDALGAFFEKRRPNFA